jgi:sodium-dependent dicarboxylate transporter 2/3/5
MKIEISSNIFGGRQKAQDRQLFLQKLHGRYVTLFFVLLFGLLGFTLAPDDWVPGQYTAGLQVNLPDQTLTADFPFTLDGTTGDATGEPVSLTTQAGAYQLVFEGAETVAYQLGQQLTFRLQVLDGNGRPVPLALDKAAVTLTGPNLEQPLPPTQQVDDRLVFTMRLPYKAKIMLGLLFLVAGLWLTELVPLAAAASLVPIVVVITGVTEPAAIFQPFAHPIVVLFLAGFLMAEGMRRTGVDRLIALNILRRASLKPAALMLTMMALTAFLSMWMSNTASVAVIIPIALAIVDRIPTEAGQTGFRRALILGVAYAAGIGGIGSAIGTPANILAMTYLNEYMGTKLAFIDWFAYGLPMVLIMVPVIWLFLILAFRVRTGDLSNAFSRDVYTNELRSLGPLNRGQKTLLWVFAAVVALWLTEQWHGIPTPIVALAGVFILFFSRTILEEDLKRINWNALLTFGGGLAIGTILVTTGVSDWVALQLTGLSVLPPLLVVVIVAGLTLLTGAFISNTACAAMLIPLAIPLAQILHLDPRLLVVVIAIASSIDFALVVGTPPTMMAYSTGLFTTGDIFKRGIVLDFIGLLLLSFGIIWIWQLLGVVAIG